MVKLFSYARKKLKTEKKKMGKKGHMCRETKTMAQFSLPNMQEENETTYVKL